MNKRKFYAKELEKLVNDEDLDCEKLKEASEGLLPNIMQFLNKKKFPKKWCIKVDVDNYHIVQKWCGIYDLNYGVYVFHDKTWFHVNSSKVKIKEISIKKFKLITSQ